ncbi:MAG: hypothetical protein KIT33_15545 [Candidatus Kapabacteria bacterium]|nr:hypothetical protein [Ignavibacteriota bacterium]MCW5886384.1 hypothetical protein [Candidatus Kapabacteria bacterium]
MANESGTLDIFGCYKGLFYAVEVKREGEKATALQLINIRQIQEHGGIALIVTNVEQVKKFFATIA